MGLFSTTHINNEYNYPRCGREISRVTVSSGGYHSSIFCKGTMLDVGLYFECSSCRNRVYKEKVIE